MGVSLSSSAGTEPGDAVREVARFLHDRGLRLATAESCTAGLIASLLADLPGAGAILECAFVVYTPAAKQHLLGVSPHTIETCNLTSEAVAREMARGVLRSSQANLVIANTGVTDAVDDRVPPGTQCFAWGFRLGGPEDDAVYSETRRFEGTRNEIRRAAAEHALRRVQAYCAMTDRRR